MRERAAYLLGESLGWGFVPPTVIREDAPLGVGSLQWFVQCDFQQHYFTLFQDAPETHPELSRMALFDFVANNTDRKSGHVLRGDDDRIWGIDHGLCFSAVFKLRTVIWDFAGEPIPEALLADIAPLTEAVPADLAELLDDEEVTALQRRVQRMLTAVALPGPDGHAVPLAAGLRELRTQHAVAEVAELINMAGNGCKEASTGHYRESLVPWPGPSSGGSHSKSPTDPEQDSSHGPTTTSVTTVMNGALR